MHGIVSSQLYYLITPPHRAITTATGIRWTLHPAVVQSVRDRHHGESQTESLSPPGTRRLPLWCVRQLPLIGTVCFWLYVKAWALLTLKHVPSFLHATFIPSNTCQQCLINTMWVIMCYMGRTRDLNVGSRSDELWDK